MTDPRPHPTTWTAPDRLPSRHDLQPAPLPADLEALVRSGHLTEVEPGCYRRAPRRPTRHPPHRPHGSSTTSTSTGSAPLRLAAKTLIAVTSLLPT